MEQFTFVKRGYDPEEVDKYITTLEQVIKSYKDKDNAIKNTMISAQVAADNLVRNAQSEAESYKLQIGKQIVGMRASLDRQRDSLQDLQDAYTNSVRKCIQELENFDMNNIFARLDEMDAAINDLHSLEAVSKDSPMPSQSIDRGYPRDTIQDTTPRRDQMHESYDREYQRESAPMRNRETAQSPYDAIRDTGRDMRGQSNLAPDPYGTDRDMYPREMAQPREAIRDTGRDTRSRDTRDMARHDDEMQQYPRENMRDTGRDMMRGDDRDMRDERDMVRDTRRGDYAHAPEPQHEARRSPRDDFGRDIRRDYGRDMRRDSDRYMRDDGMGRLDSREPMRDRGRQYAPSADDYNDHDQNLLPPVASLM